MIKSEKNSRAQIHNYPVDLVSLGEALDLIKERIESNLGGQVITINPEMVFQAIKSPQLDEVLKSAELVIPDGIGVIIALRKLGYKTKQLPGIEFSENLIKTCAEKGYTVGFIGASPEVVGLAVKELQLKYPELKVVFVNDGFFNEKKESELIKKLQESAPQVLFTALGVPKQELWISKYKNALNHTIMVGVGGSFDVWAKKVKRAPVLFRRFGLEWLYRLLTQPSRFTRMFPTLPLFFCKVMLDRNFTKKVFIAGYKND